MASTKFTLVRGRALRVTKLNGCGAVLPGSRNMVSTEGFISIGLTANTEEGEAISVTNAAGNVCVLDDPPPKFTGYSIEVQFCGVDPELFALMTGQPVVLDAAGTLAVGVQVNSDVDVNLTGFAMELWSNVPAAACDVTGAASYGYMVIPFVKGGTLGDVTIENAAINFTLTGAASKDGNAWGVGPYNVVKTAGGADSPLLVALPTKNHLHLQLTTVPPPAFTNGAGPVGAPATNANVTTTTPATLTPTNSYPPDTLAAAVAAGAAFTATPTTAWAAGKYVVLGDGSKAKWSGTAWVTYP